MRHALPAVSALALTMACAPALAQQAPAIDAERMNQAVRVLASDAFEGRAPASPGEETVSYTHLTLPTIYSV